MIAGNDYGLGRSYCWRCGGDDGDSSLELSQAAVEVSGGDKAALMGRGLAEYRLGDVQQVRALALVVVGQILSMAALEERRRQGQWMSCLTVG